MGIGGLGFGELVLIFAVLLLLFGAKRLPELASGMGKGIRDFKRSLNGLEDQALQQNLPSSSTSQQLQSGQTQTASQGQATAEAEPKRLQD